MRQFCEKLLDNQKHFTRKRSLIMNMRTLAATLIVGVLTPFVWSQPDTPRVPSERLPRDWQRSLPGRTPLNPPLATDVAAPDLSAERITFRIVRRTAPFRGTVEIQGTVKNLGGHFVSGAKQQEVQLYEEVPGGRGRIVARLPFSQLRAGEELTIRYQRAWDASSPAEGEFPPTYRLVIAFDPDVLIDGNPRNDDRNSRNNTRSESGIGINSMFHR
jgi:hypothetical protein